MKSQQANPEIVLAGVVKNGRLADYVTIAQAALLIPCSESLIAKLLRTHRLKRYKFERLTFLRQTELLALIVAAGEKEIEAP